MRRTSRLWPAIESVAGQEAVETEWRSLVGDEFETLRPFLRARREPATGFTARDQRGQRAFRVVRLGDDAYVGVCDETHERILLSGAGVVVHGFDRDRFAMGLATACGLQGGAPFVWERSLAGLGTLKLADEHTHLALAFPAEPDMVGRSVISLHADGRIPFVLFIPTRQCLRPCHERSARAVGSVILTLDEQITLGPGWAVRLNQTFDEWHVDIERALGAVKRPDNVPENYIRPSGAVWEVKFAGKTAHVEDSVGWRYIVHLIRHKRKCFAPHVLEAEAFDREVVRHFSGDAVLDDATLEARRVEYEELCDLRDQAIAAGSSEMAASYQSKIDKLGKTVSAGLPFRGHVPRLGSQMEKARVAVTMAIGRAKKAVDQRHEPLAVHLVRSIFTHGSCRYEPAPDCVWKI